MEPSEVPMVRVYKTLGGIVVANEQNHVLLWENTPPRQFDGLYEVPVFSVNPSFSEEPSVVDPSHFFQPGETISVAYFDPSLAGPHREERVMQASLRPRARFDELSQKYLGVKNDRSTQSDLICSEYRIQIAELHDKIRGLEAERLHKISQLPSPQFDLEGLLP